MTARKPGAMTRVEAAANARAAMAKKRPPLNERFWSKVDIRGDDECWHWKAAPRRKDQGYGAFWMNGRHHPSSKVAWLLTNGEIQGGMEVCHRCDTPSCCNPKHLFLGTRLENNDDKVSKGRHVFGTRVWTCKLTPEQVRFIREQRPPGIKRAPVGLAGRLAEQFGVSKQYISELWANEGWRNI